MKMETTQKNKELLEVASESITQLTAKANDFVQAAMAASTALSAMGSNWEDNSERDALEFLTGRICASAGIAVGILADAYFKYHLVDGYELERQCDCGMSYCWDMVTAFDNCAKDHPGNPAFDMLRYDNAYGKQFGLIEPDVDGVGEDGDADAYWTITPEYLIERGCHFLEAINEFVATKPIKKRSNGRSLQKKNKVNS